MDLLDFGFDPAIFALENKIDEPGRIPAQVTAVHRERFDLICEKGPCFGRLKAGVYYGAGAEDFPTAGDFVLIDCPDNGDALIVRTLPRRSFFVRRDPDPGRGGQAVAANFDYVFILQSLNADFNLRRLERYVTLGRQSGAAPVVVLTKADLAEDFSAQLHAAEQTSAGAPVYAVSARTGAGLDRLAGYLKPRKTLVFLGSSGVGKSSLINALAGAEVMATGDIRENDGRGRHTTTHRQLLVLPGGAMVIDTPGMRELGMWDVTEGLGGAFADVERFLGKCRFSDCRHENEPGCAIRAAIESGALSSKRWESYMALKDEIRYSDDRAGYLRRKQQWHKEITKKIKQMKRNGDSGKWN